MTEGRMRPSCTCHLYKIQLGLPRRPQSFCQWQNLVRIVWADKPYLWRCDILVSLQLLHLGLYRLGYVLVPVGGSYWLLLLWGRSLLLLLWWRSCTCGSVVVRQVLETRGS